MELTLEEWQELAAQHRAAVEAVKALDHALVMAACQCEHRDDETGGFDVLMKLTAHTAQALSCLDSIHVRPQSEWVGMHKNGDPAYIWWEPNCVGFKRGTLKPEAE